MIPEIQETLGKLGNNEKTKITFQGEKFILKRNKKKILIFSKLPFLFIFSTFISIFISILFIQPIARILDITGWFAGQSDDGTTGWFFSFSNLIRHQNFWIVHLILAMLLGYKLSKVLNLWLTRIIHKDKYLALRDILNNSVIPMPSVQDDKETDSLSEIKKLNINDHTDYERLQEILNNAERKLNQYKDE